MTDFFLKVYDQHSENDNSKSKNGKNSKEDFNHQNWKNMSGDEKFSDLIGDCCKKLTKMTIFVFLFAGSLFLALKMTGFIKIYED